MICTNAPQSYYDASCAVKLTSSGQRCSLRITKKRERGNEREEKKKKKSLHRILEVSNDNQRDVDTTYAMLQR